MKKIYTYLRQYFTELDKRVFALCALFIALFIFVNYYHGLSRTISTYSGFKRYFSWYCVFLLAFSFGYFSFAFLAKRKYFSNKNFLVLLIIAPAIFSWKMVYHVQIHISDDAVQDAYWNNIIYYPFKLIAVTLVLFIIWKTTHQTSSLYGVTLKDFDFRPYAWMLLIMLPLVALASTQHDFLAMYPKLRAIAFLKAENSGLYKLLYELSYGSDFFTIEIFFRGFLILAFAKWAGKDAILPMAMFYCTIHFGKPLGECISSFFGGMVLGVVIYHTRTLFGGLMVHLGIAWMMELGGYLGSLYIK